MSNELMVKKDYSLSSLIDEFNRIFDLLNKNLFENNLEKPVIVVQSSRKRVMGSFSCAKVWINKDDNKQNKHEITITSEYLNREIEDIIGTLIHEMVHLHCSMNNIKDTSNNCVYHNKRFKKEAEDRGLIITHAQTIGWSVTSLQDSTKELIKTFNINEDLFSHYKYSFNKTVEPKKPKEPKKQWKNKKVKINDKNAKALGAPVKISGNLWIPVLLEESEQPIFVDFNNLHEEE